MKDYIQIEGVKVEWLGHASFLITYEGKKIFIDPFKISGKISESNKADFIFITHSHYDHCSPEDITKLLKDDTIIVCPADCNSKLNRIQRTLDIKIIEPNSSIKINDMLVETMPAYNINKSFHKREYNWLGYLIKVGGVSIYHSGDTDLIPEMKELKGKVDIALLPVGGTYTMNSEEASEAVRIISPKLAVPMHYGTIVGSLKDAQDFKELVGEKATILRKKN